MSPTAKSTKSRRSSKSTEPQRPYPEFPLLRHAAGRRAKKIRQKRHYFGKLADNPEGKAATEEFNRQWPFLKDGRLPPPVDTGDGCTVRALVNAFLASKQAAVDSGELPQRSTELHSFAFGRGLNRAYKIASFMVGAAKEKPTSASSAELASLPACRQTRPA